MELLESTSTLSEDQRLERLLARTNPERIVVITGAGISAESGIPTYRGEEGYWTETSANYQPEQTSYLSFFEQQPREVWRFALEHRRICAAAQPNVAHHALVAIERALGDGFLLVTQNVDGLHRRAGNSVARTIEAHGSLHVMRPVDGEPTLLPIPAAVECPRRGEPLDDASFSLLVTADGRRTRPHTMFFDEPYDEQLYRSGTAFDAAKRCELFIVIGTSGATAMPWHLALHAREADAAIVVVDPEETPFAVHARNRERDGKGLWLRGPGTAWVPRIAELLLAQRERPRARVAEPEHACVKPRRATIVHPEIRLEPVVPADEGSRALAELLGRRQPKRAVVITGEEANAVHMALARLEQAFGDDLRLITQNIQGLSWEEALAVGRDCDLLITIGASGVGTMSYAITAGAVLEAGAALIDINPMENPYAEHARDLAEQGRGLWLQGAVSHWVPEVVEQLIELRARLAQRAKQ